MTDQSRGVVRYGTIVADPPWDYPEGFAIRGPRTKRGGPRTGEVRISALPYPSMSIQEIADLPIGELAAHDCRLFLWRSRRSRGSFHDERSL